MFKKYRKEKCNKSGHKKLKKKVYLGYAKYSTYCDLAHIEWKFSWFNPFFVRIKKEIFYCPRCKQEIRTKYTNIRDIHSITMPEKLYNILQETGVVYTDIE